MIEVQNLDHISVEETESSSSIIITFKFPTVLSYDIGISDHTSEIEIPRAFLITISRFYPHTCPQIQCIQPNIVSSAYILPDGNVQHPALGDNWSALGSLWTVIEILTFIRSEYANHASGSMLPSSSTHSDEVDSFSAAPHSHVSLSPDRKPPGDRMGGRAGNQYGGSPSHVSDSRMFQAVAPVPSALYDHSADSMHLQDEATSVCEESLFSAEAPGQISERGRHTMSHASYRSVAYDVVYEDDRIDDMDSNPSDEI